MKEQMPSSFENTGEGRLGPGEAQEEANMMRAHLGVSPETGKIPRDTLEERYPEDYPGKEPTAKDYDEALKVVEELKKSADEEPAVDKVLTILGRVGAVARYLAESVLLKTSHPQPWEEENLEERHEQRLNKYDDAMVRLATLKAEAGEFGKKQKEREVEEEE